MPIKGNGSKFPKDYTDREAPEDGRMVKRSKRVCCHKEDEDIILILDNANHDTS